MRIVSCTYARSRVRHTRRRSWTWLPQAQGAFTSSASASLPATATRLPDALPTPRADPSWWRLWLRTGRYACFALCVVTSFSFPTRLAQVRVWHAASEKCVAALAAPTATTIAFRVRDSTMLLLVWCSAADTTRACRRMAPRSSSAATRARCWSGRCPQRCGGVGRCSLWASSDVGFRP